MIAEAEIRRCAARWGVDPMVADLDYSLGWFLAAITTAGKPPGLWLFKGGTCLRKCYFEDYRFSEDLDFTATAFISPQALLEWVERATRWAVDHDGPDFAAAPPRLEVIEDEYGSESYQVRVYYRGPLRWGGSPRAIRLDVTRDEQVLWPSVPRPLSHPYSDAEALGPVELTCYALEEILAEKVRAVSGQRRFAISRDLYDIHRLVQAGVSAASVAPRLTAKFAARGVEVTALDADRLLASRASFEQDWERRMGYLAPDADATTFTAAWQATVEVVRLAQLSLKGPSRS
jgi:predicted nucleotidyltransferase component of viral defense system